MLNLNDVHLFVKVVEWNGFAPASRALRIPKSTLSKRVGELERSLDVTLIRRTTRRFVVTPVGRAFHTHALAMVQLADAAEQTVRGHQAEPAGPVSVTCSVPTAQTWLAGLLPKVAREHPKIQIALHATDRFVDVVRDGFDIVVRDHFGPLPDSSLVQRKVAVDAMILVASPGYLRRKGAPRVPVDLTKHDALLTHPGKNEWTLRPGEAEERRRTRRDSGKGDVTIRVGSSFAADETSVLLAAARDGLGIVPVPARACAQDIARGALRRVLPAWSAGRVTTTLLLADRRAQLPSVRAVADAIAASAGSNDGADSPRASRRAGAPAR